MSRFEIHTIQEQSLSEVADYFARWRQTEEHRSADQTNGASNPHRIENVAYLRWLLVENPARNGEMNLGYCVRDQKEAIVGAILTFPSHFVRAEKRLQGFCGASFYVNPEARIQAFIILKKFLSAAGKDFYFTTTCNAEAGALWDKFRGRGLPVPNSESIYILPYRIEKLLEAFAENRNFHQGLVSLMRAAGKIGSTLAANSRKSSRGLCVAPCRDWEKLADLARIHRDPEWITNERSARFLEWRYGRNPAGDQKELYRFWDDRGNEGWFAVGSGLVGRRKNIRMTEVLDIVWPRKTADPRQILAAVVRQCASASDALYMRPRIGLPLNQFSRLVLRSKYESAQFYVMAGKGNGALDPSQFDFVAADGDSWP